MKAKTLFAATLLVAGAAFADSTTVETEYVLGVLPVSATGIYTKQVVVSIPWVDEGTGGNIGITNLIKTAGLPADVQLHWYNADTGKFQHWEVSGNQWVPVKSVTDASVSEDASDVKQLERGGAVLLTTATDTLPSSIYVVGQVGTSASVTTTIAANTTTLVAPPQVSTTNFDLNDITWEWANVDAGDVITVGYAAAGFPIAYTNGLGGAESTTKWYPAYKSSSGATTIKAGKGFWYKHVGSSAMTITWSAPYVPDAPAE